LDVCFENTRKGGAPPQSVTTRQLAEAVIELYWPQTLPFVHTSDQPLRQNTLGQAEIVSLIRMFRERSVENLAAPLANARQTVPHDFERLVQTVEWKLIEMPLPRLQIIGGTEDRFLYEYAWGQDVRRADVQAYQAGQKEAFNNVLLLQAGVGEALIQLNGLLRPLIYRQWAAMVARINRLPDTHLEDFLFGVDRTTLAPVREPLRELQKNACFYCHGRLEREAEVDHFIPWARYPDNAIDNLVLAHAKCNQSKRDFFAALPHVARWRERAAVEGDSLHQIAAVHRWDDRPEQTLSIARALYLHLPTNYQLWVEKGRFLELDRGGLVGVL
jgi:5-methylcytosine-specific restriction endonuclease McrA